MTKYINRQKLVTKVLQQVGNSETPDSTAVTVIERDGSDYVTLAKGTTVPTDAEAGYSKGCLFVDTNASAGAVLFLNEGDESSCNFNAVGNDLPAGAVSSTEILDGTITADDLGSDSVQSDEIDDETIEEVDLSANLKKELLTMAVHGTFAAPGFPFDVETETEQTAALAVVDDGGAQALLSVSGAEDGYTANYQLFPDTELENDAAYFGATTPFGVLVFDIDTAATYGADSLEWEYYDGATWQTLTILWDTTNSSPAANGARSFMQDGHVIFSAPSDWASTSVNSQEGYWVRARVKSGFNISQIPTLNSVEHKLVSCATAFEMPFPGTISRGRFSWITESGANNDSKIILCNLTKGTASAIKTLTQALTVHEVADFSVACDTGDQLAIFGTQEDGTTEFADGVAELLVTRS